MPKLDQTAASWPKVDTAPSHDLASLPVGPGAYSLLLGASSTTWGTIPLPFDATVIGMTGCSLFTSIDESFNGAHAGSTATSLLPIPNDFGLLGAVLYLQTFVLDAGANTLGATLSNPAEITIGS